MISSTLGFELTKQYYLGSTHYPSHTLRWLCVSFGTLLTATSVALLCVAYRFGPRALTERRMKPCIVFWVLTPPAFALFHACNRQALQPYQDRFTFVVTAFFTIASRNTVAMLSYLPAEHGPPSTPPTLTLLRAVLRAVRMTDAVSDIIFVQTLWEQVRIQNFT